MNRKKQQNLKKFDAYAMAFWLAQQCNYREQHADKATYSGDYRTIEQSALASVLASETTVVNQYATFVGYLKVIAKIFYITFVRKEKDRPAPILRGVFFIQ